METLIWRPDIKQLHQFAYRQSAGERNFFLNNESYFTFLQEGNRQMVQNGQHNLHNFPFFIAKDKKMEPVKEIYGNPEYFFGYFLAHKALMMAFEQNGKYNVPIVSKEAIKAYHANLREDLAYLRPENAGEWEAMQRTYLQVHFPTIYKFIRDAEKSLKALGKNFSYEGVYSGVIDMYSLVAKEIFAKSLDKKFELPHIEDSDIIGREDYSTVGGFKISESVAKSIKEEFGNNNSAFRNRGRGLVYEWFSVSNGINLSDSETNGEKQNVLLEVIQKIIRDEGIICPKHLTLEQTVNQYFDGFYEGFYIMYRQFLVDNKRIKEILDPDIKKGMQPVLSVLKTRPRQIITDLSREIAEKTQKEDPIYFKAIQGARGEFSFMYALFGAFDVRNILLAAHARTLKNT